MEMTMRFQVYNLGESKDKFDDGFGGRVRINDVKWLVPVYKAVKADKRDPFSWLDKDHVCLDPGFRGFVWAFYGGTKIPDVMKSEYFARAKLQDHEAARFAVQRQQYIDGFQLARKKMSSSITNQESNNESSKNANDINDEAFWKGSSWC